MAAQQGNIIGRVAAGGAVGEADIDAELHVVKGGKVALFTESAIVILAAFVGKKAFAVAADAFNQQTGEGQVLADICLLYTSPSPRDVEESRMPSSA